MSITEQHNKDLNASLDCTSGEFRIGDSVVSPTMTVDQFRNTVPYGNYDEHRDLSSYNLITHVTFREHRFEVIVSFKGVRLWRIDIIISRNDRPVSEPEEISAGLVSALVQPDLPGSFWGRLSAKNTDHVYTVEIVYMKLA